MSDCARCGGTGGEIDPDPHDERTYPCQQCQGTGEATDPRVNPCPECPEGEVVDDGPMERDTGHQPVRCSDHCGWSA